ncbi:MAG: hypothetical protein CL760_05345 [Chloroflexi bacterium]|nr:hypothetical protein [Chloroflexota bacterium]|tara:strand:+ start:29084 stop:29512 length:429 start_codon:yes stop_codon:yes gene_type:complete
MKNAKLVMNSKGSSVTGLSDTMQEAYMQGDLVVAKKAELLTLIYTANQLIEKKVVPDTESLDVELDNSIELTEAHIFNVKDETEYLAASIKEVHELVTRAKESLTAQGFKKMKELLNVDFLYFPVEEMYEEDKSSKVLYNAA